MTNDTITTRNDSIVFDGWRSISIALFMALVGYSVMVSVPVLSTVFVVSGSMAIVALFLYMGVSVYMHSRKSVLAEAA